MRDGRRQKGETVSDEERLKLRWTVERAPIVQLYAWAVEDGHLYGFSSSRIGIRLQDTSLMQLFHRQIVASKSSAFRPQSCQVIWDKSPYGLLQSSQASRLSLVTDALKCIVVCMQK